MQPSKVLFFILSSLAGMALTLPTADIKMSSSLVAERDLEDRAIVPLLAAVASLVGDVANIVNGVQQSDAEKQGAFTGQLVTAFRNRYPDYNVIVFHSQDSQYDFDDTEVHYHYELPISFGTYGYEVLVFQYGWFQRAGDGGFQQWRYAGCYQAGVNGYVQFYPISSCS